MCEAKTKIAKREKNDKSTIIIRDFNAALLVTEKEDCKSVKNIEDLCNTAKNLI